MESKNKFNLFKSKKEKVEEVKIVENVENKSLGEKVLMYYKSNTKKCWILVGTLVVGVFLINKGIGFVSEVSSKAEKGLPVTTSVLETSTIDNDIVYAAKVEAESSVPVILKASGEVEKVYVSLGDYVEEGTVLFEIDEDDLRKNVNALNAQYNSAIAGLNAAKANYQSAINGSTDVNVIQAKSQRDSLEAQYNAAVEMVGLGAISEVEFNQLKAGFEAADKAYKILVEQGVSGSKDAAYSQYQQAQAGVEQTRIALENARELLRDAKVKAPISGVVASLNAKEKNMLQAGMTPCMIVNADSLEISLSVSESVVSLIKKGDTVDITLNAFPGETFTGIIDGVSEAAGMTSTYPVVIKLENAEGKIKSGMFGKVIFSTNKKENAIVIPRDAMITLGEETFVFVEENGIAKKKYVEVGIDNGKDIEIVSGLNAGEELIIKGQDYLEDGDEVRVVEG